MSDPSSILSLRALLLDLISIARPVDQSTLDALTEDQWSLLMGMVKQHRLGPLLHWQLLNHRTTLSVPSAVWKSLADLYQQSAIRNLQIKRELATTNRLLDAENIKPVHLKGAYLAWWVYPHPALRPLRDLDVLVPIKEGLSAYQVLLDGGLSRINKYGYQGDLDTVVGLSQHLPPLRSASGLLNIELHTRVFHISEDHRGHSDLSDEDAFWNRASSVELAGQRISFESPTDLMLHLIVHAVYDHEFTNGPLVLSDLAFLLQTHSVDWPFFWSMARRFGYEPGCTLMLNLLEFYWGDMSVDWCGNANKQMNIEVEEIKTLMLRDFDLRITVNRQLSINKNKSVNQKIYSTLRKFFPSKERMASHFPISKDNSFIYFYYPLRWLEAANNKLSKLLSPQKKKNPLLINDVELVTKLREIIKQ